VEARRRQRRRRAELIPRHHSSPHGHWAARCCLRLGLRRPHYGCERCGRRRRRRGPTGCQRFEGANESRTAVEV